MAPERTLAIVLKRTDYGEYDRVIQLCTPLGNRSVIAKGVRKERSKLAGGVELLTESEVIIRPGKGSLAILGSARMKQFFRHILEDYDKTMFAYEVLGYVQKAGDGVDEPEWFELVHEVLSGLDATSTPFLLVKTRWFLRYAAILGHELSLQYDTSGQLLSPNATYRYDTQDMGLVADEKGVLTADHIKLLRLIALKPLPTLAQVGGIDAVLPQCFAVAREHAAV